MHAFIVVIFVALYLLHAEIERVCKCYKAVNATRVFLQYGYAQPGLHCVRGIWIHRKYLNGTVKEPNMFHNYETEKITCKASDVAENLQFFGSSARDRHSRCI